jgi:hypothetical protein
MRSVLGTSREIFLLEEKKDIHREGSFFPYSLYSYCRYFNVRT